VVNSAQFYDRTGEYVAIEPHPGLRTALLARIVDDDSPTSHVTVLAADVLTAQLPDRIAGLIAMNVIGHLNAEERGEFWQLLAQKLTHGGRAVLDIHPPTRPEGVPEAPMAQAQLGRLCYTGRASAEPAEPDAVTWTMSYTVSEGDQQVAELSASDHWDVVTPEQMAGELAPLGLRAEPVDGPHGLHVITRR
jgi:hypothetical protein